MASRQNSQKRRAWEVRFQRFRASGLSVARFCEQERVSANTFYYWAKRIGSAAAKSAWPKSLKAPRRGGEPATSTDEISNIALVRFFCSGAVKVTVPADCLDAIRCLAECLQHAGVEHSEAFQEVVVSA